MASDENIIVKMMVIATQIVRKIMSFGRKLLFQVSTWLGTEPQPPLTEAQASTLGLRKSSQFTYKQKHVCTKIMLMFQYKGDNKYQKFSRRNCLKNMHFGGKRRKARREFMIPAKASHMLVKMKSRCNMSNINARFK